MNTKHSLLIASGLSLLLIGLGCNSGDKAITDPKSSAVAAKPATPTAQQALDVFSSRCMPCHATGTPAEGLALDNIDGILKGGEDGAVITAGDAANSLIIQRMRASNGKKIMPPKGEQASEAQIKAVEDWINAGAPKA